MQRERDQGDAASNEEEDPLYVQLKVTLGGFDCVNCGKIGATIPCHGRCHHAFYCSRDCLVFHSANHRYVCLHYRESQMSEADDDEDDIDRHRLDSTTDAARKRRVAAAAAVVDDRHTQKPMRFPHGHVVMVGSGSDDGCGMASSMDALDAVQCPQRWEDVDSISETTRRMSWRTPGRGWTRLPTARAAVELHAALGAVEDAGCATVGGEGGAKLAAVGAEVRLGRRPEEPRLAAVGDCRHEEHVVLTGRVGF
ncbi:Aste57867_17122 [Aphanomyces stellatus]|uniref:Aste57867_17122 protein n=1 Tax=Aphanomyces stellatus TaxID=120398 RepID=A0A485L748_9STRA|nr:hypothetical protein As57867_017063 [Aphanomyces stellatus]VFT93880.1 Aste57867_17122 [Aphanomyces stellatus]